MIMRGEYDEEKIKAVEMYLDENKTIYEIEQGYLGYKTCAGAVERRIVEFKHEDKENAF